MRLAVKMRESNERFPVRFGEVHNISDGGFERGYAAGKEDGSTFYNDFWDILQENGTRTDCGSLFYGAKWTDQTFKPKYDITPTIASDMFSSSLMTDINKSLQEQGIKIDLSTGSLTVCNHLMARAKSISCPSKINIENSSKIGSMFYMNSAIQEVHLIGVKETHTWASSVFQNCYALTNLTIDGVIGNSFTVAQSTLLTDGSVQSVISALKDLTGETAQTVTFAVAVKRKMTDEQIAQITAKNWTLA